MPTARSSKFPWARKSSSSGWPKILRLTGGEFRGRLIHTPKDLKTRPTQARLRQALFNSLQLHIPDAKVLDLFAGSGALGFEALSRGAAEVVFVENGRVAARMIDRNAQELGVKGRITLLEDSLESLGRIASELKRLGPFDIVLADPPYAGGWEEKLLEDLPWEKILAPAGHFCLEWGTRKSQVAELPERAQVLVKVREKNYGDSVLTTYRRSSEASDPAGSGESSESERG